MPTRCVSCFLIAFSCLRFFLFGHIRKKINFPSASAGTESVQAVQSEVLVFCSLEGALPVDIWLKQGMIYRESKV